MYVYTATIGRNVPRTLIVDGEDRNLSPVPMTVTMWEQFIEDVKADMSMALHLDTEPIAVEIHRGKGAWEGVEEESAKITLLAESSRHFGLADLRSLLSENARQYGQDAITLTIGQSELC
jgi:hypothetical protein